MTVSSLDEFQRMLMQMLSPNNDERKAAEEAYNRLKEQHPNQCFSTLFELGVKHADPKFREQCFIFLRRSVVNGEISKPEAAQAKLAIRNGLLHSLECEQSHHARSTICNLIAEFGVDGLANWPELLPSLLNLTKSQNEALRESALLIFNEMASNIIDLLKPHLPIYRDVFFAGLNDPSLKVKLAALTATATVISSLPKPAERNIFQNLVPAMLGALAAALNEQKEEEATSAIEVFIDLAEVEAVFLRPHIAAVVNAMLQIASAPSLDEGLRHLGMEFLVTLCESRPGMTKKIPDFVQRTVPVILQMMVDLEENPSWNKGEEEDMEDLNCTIGEEALDRIALALGGKVLVPTLFGLINQLLNSNDWRHRHAAMMAISIVGEGCHSVIEPHLDDVVNMVLPRFADAHERVRWAACNTAGQMSTDFGPLFQEKMHSKIIPAYIRLMDDVHNPRVQSHAASAIVNFCEKCEVSIIKPYLNELLGKIIQLLQQGNTLVQEQAVTAVAAIAECIGSEFVQYYNTFMPFLKTILEKASGKELRVLRGKAMECISLIGVAVGKQVFLEDAKQIMALMQATQGTLETDDPQTQFMLQAWTRIAKCLGTDFLPYLPLVMPALLHAAAIQPAVKLMNNEDEQSNEDGWEFFPVGDKSIGIKTSLLEDKYTACNMLYVFVDELKDGFYQYVGEVAKILIPSLKFFYHDGVRSAAVSAMGPLLRCVQLRDPSQVLALWAQIFPVFMEAITSELEDEVYTEMLEGMQECIDILGPNSFNPQQLTTMFEWLKTSISEILHNRGERENKREELELEEDEEFADEGEKEEEVLGMLSDIIGKLARTHREVILPYFAEAILPLVYTMISSTYPRDRQVAICIFDDIAEFTTPGSLALFDHFLPILVCSINDASPQVRQAAVYGLGVVSSVAKEKLAPIAQDVVHRLHSIISHAEAKKPDNVHATENAISALGKIIIQLNYNPSELIPFWISQLPVVNDEVEGLVVNELLCKFIENPQFCPFVIGENFKNLQHLLHVFGSALETALVNADISNRIKAILKHMQTSVPQDLFYQAAEKLSDEEKAKLQKCISS